MRELEEKLFAQYPVTGKEKLIFIVGAPRTGTTLIYQLLCRYFDVTYLSNLANDHFAQYPAIGYCVQKAAAVGNLPLWASYGRAPGPYQPSECSDVFKSWFSTDHPSQLFSQEFLTLASLRHMQNTIAAISGLSGGKPIVIKNAWNCFRVTTLRQAFPTARFIWMRRDLEKAAASDLVSRLVVKRDPYAWNSATPSIWEKLKEKHYIAQVIENQYEYNEALMEQNLTSIWYEEMVKGSLIGDLAGLSIKLLDKPPPLTFKDDPSSRLDVIDQQALVRYIEGNKERLEPYLYDYS